MDHISQPYPLKDSRLRAGIESWDISAMGTMSFLDNIPTCDPHAWDQWDMDDLMNDTNANLPSILIVSRLLCERL